MAAMVDIASSPHLDPDAQATVTDFLDYTEYLPSDLIRSLTLIRGLDETYLSHSSTVHDLTKQYGNLPNLVPEDRPNAQTLRTHISAHLDRAATARESSYAEACRLYNVADRHHNRLNSIINKLQALPKPPSRDPTPEMAPSPEVKRSRRKIEDGTSIQRLTLNPPRASGVAVALLQKPRKRQVTVPGDVLPPYNPDSPIASTEQSDWESDAPSPVRPILKLKQPKPKKEKAPRVPRARRESLGLYNMPTPPPEDAKLGDSNLPWTHLTEWEMWKLRKRMKKNINWEPSDLMIQRELTARGRGWDNYYRAKAEAQKNGTEFLDLDSLGQGRSRSDAPLLGESATGTIEVKTMHNRGIKLNEAKKLKREILAREQAALAAQAAQEAELAARRLGDIGSAFKNLFSPLSSALAHPQRNASSPLANGSRSTGRRGAKKSSKKRKLDDYAASASPAAELDPKKKKQKVASRPTLLPSAASENSVLKIPLKLNLAAPSSTLSSLSSPMSPTRPSSARRTSVAPKTESVTPVDSRPVSRQSVAASAERGAVAARARRRTSTPASSIRKTPMVDSTPKIQTTAAGRRSKREAPGTITHSSQDGGAAVSVSTRRTKPNKQAKTGEKGMDSELPEIRVDMDGKQELIDPDEERFCLCGDISYGEMICCELEERCEFGQWFHMDCVELPGLPPRTVKWYCPGCRKKYKQGENSNGLVGRGIK